MKNRSAISNIHTAKLMSVFILSIFLDVGNASSAGLGAGLGGLGGTVGGGCGSGTGGPGTGGAGLGGGVGTGGGTGSGGTSSGGGRHQPRIATASANVIAVNKIFCAKILRNPQYYGQQFAKLCRSAG